MINRFFIAAPIALAVSAAFLGAATTPANAAAPTQCATMPAQLRAAAATATPDASRKALNYVRTGEALCAADADREAAGKFAVAAKTLGLDPAQLAATTPATTAN